MRQGKKKTAKFLDSPLNKRLRELLAERQVRTDDLASALSVTPEAVRLWCTGYARPDIDKLIPISFFFNVSVDYLLGNTDIKSVEMDLKKISDMTGLSEKAIEVLFDIGHHHFGNEVQAVQAINLLVEQEKPSPDEVRYYHDDFFDDDGYKRDCVEWETQDYVKALESIGNYLFTYARDNNMYKITMSGKLKLIPKEINANQPKGFRIDYDFPIKHLSQGEIIEHVLYMDVQEKLRKLRQKIINRIQNKARDDD